MKTTAALVTVPLLVLALSGCTPGDPGGEEPTAEEPTDGETLEAGSTACLTDREWNLDVADAAAQLGDQLASSGLTVVSSVGEGSQSLWFDQEGYVGSSTNLTYTLVADMDGGLVMTMAQHHEGDPGGQWAWEGEAESTLTFTDWDANYTVTTDTSINGTAAPTSTIPAGGLAGLGGTSMTVACDGDSLTTQAEGSPFVQHWTAGASR